MAEVAKRRPQRGYEVREPHERVERQRGQEALVRHRAAVGEVRRMRDRVESHEAAAHAEMPWMLVGEAAGQGPPDDAGAAALREAKAVVGPPGDVVPPEADVLADPLHVHGRDTIADPAPRELFRRIAPHLEVVRPQEEARDALAEALVDPLPEVGGPARGDRKS